ncbi:MAG: 2'-5' RNA ligase family protein [Promethearchaeota archaeon]|jgi:2'-5' RNA ligase
MSKVYTSAVVIIPPKEKWAPIQEIRKLYDRNIDRWMPHITLLYPFRSQNEYQNLEIIFTEVCKKFKPFEVSLKDFRYFIQRHQSYTLWLDPEPNNSIIKLQAEILQLVPDCNEVNKFKNGFRPHLSLGQIKGRTELLDIVTLLQKKWKEIKFIVDKVCFISQEKSKTSSFKISKQILFKKDD